MSLVEDFLYITFLWKKCPVCINARACSLWGSLKERALCKPVFTFSAFLPCGALAHCVGSWSDAAIARPMTPNLRRDRRFWFFSRCGNEIFWSKLWHFFCGKVEEFDVFLRINQLIQFSIFFQDNICTFIEFFICATKFLN